MLNFSQIYRATKLRFKYPNFHSHGLFKFSSSEVSIQPQSNASSENISNSVSVETQQSQYQKISFIIDNKNPDNKFIYNTQFGYLKYLDTSLSPKSLEQISTAYYIHNFVPSNYLKKIFKSDQNSFIIFQPQTNFTNMMQTFFSTQALIDTIYFGNKRRPLNPFKNCQTNLDIFNLHRQILKEKNHFYNQICFLVSENGNIRLKGSNVPQSQLINKFLKNKYDGPQLSFHQHDFLVSIPQWQGIHSAENYQKNGVSMRCLGSRKIFSFFGVFPPTQQTYYDQFYQFLQDKQAFIKSSQSALDVGTGTGILSFILNQVNPEIPIYSLDKSQEAVDCTKMNSQVLDISNRIFSSRIDINFNSSKPADKQQDFKAQLSNLGFPTKYDIIISNPPWVTAKNLNLVDELETGVFDQDSSFIKNLFQLADECLTTQSPTTKNGRLFLFYSNISENIGLQQKDFIQQLCLQHKFVIRSEQSHPFLSDEKVGNDIDPLFNVKSESTINFYEISRA